MTELLYILIGLVGLSVVVFIHEAGHFLAARAVGVEVEAFAIGWGKPLWRWKPRKTEYRICAFPLGGYCKMKGEQFLMQVFEDGDKNAEPEPGSFFAAKPWRRIVIAVAGPLFNLLFALLVLSLLQVVGVPETVPSSKIILASEIDGKGPLPADRAGLQSGDVVQEIAGTKVRNFRDLQSSIAKSDQKPLGFKVERGNTTVNLTVQPEWNAQDKRVLVGVYPWIDPVIKEVISHSSSEIAGLQKGDKIVSMNGTPVPHTQAIYKILKDKSPSYTIEFVRDGKSNSTRVIPDVVGGNVSLGIEYLLPSYPAVGKDITDAFVEGANQTGTILSQMGAGLVQLVMGKTNLSDSLSGPIRITYYVGEVASKSFLAGWGEGVGAVTNFLCFISLALFLMNLLPIPALDGGSVVINVIEIFRKKRLTPKTLVRYQQVGVLFIFLIIIFTTVNDVTFLFGPK